MKAHEVLWAIEDIIGKCKSWPKWITEIFWSLRMKDEESLRLVTFCLGNALPPHLLLQWLRVRGVKYNAKKLDQRILRVGKQLQLDWPECNFWTLNMKLQEYCFVNGQPRDNRTGRPKPPRDIPWYITPWAP